MTPDLSRITAVAFDLDGTLINSAPDIGYAVNTALAAAGLQRFDLSTVVSWIGDGPDALIARALVAQGLSSDDEALRQRLRRSFDDATLAAPLDHGFVYPGIAELLRQLNNRHFRLAVVTNKPTHLALAVVEAAGLLPYLSHVQGADTPAQRKPAPLMLLAAASRLGVATPNMLMVGDAPPDMLAAQSAGCPAALVGWGYGEHAVPAALAPWRVNTVPQLRDALLGAARTNAEPTGHAIGDSPPLSVD